MTATWRLVRLALRRDRIVLVVWVVAIAGLAWGTVQSYVSLTQTEADRIAAAALVASNPLSRVFDGPASGPSVGAMSMNDGYKILGILTALMAAQAVVRHSRRDEETGRAELVGSAVVGRRAPLAAAVVVALTACVAVGVGVALAVGATGVGWTGAWAGGMAVAGAGWVFAGIAAVASQVFGTSRGANGAAAGALGAAFVLRAIGDLTGHVAPGGLSVVSAWPSWLSPLGWGQQVRPYFLDRWWIAGLFAGTTLLLVLVAAALRGRRDLGTGMVGAPHGPARAPAGLLSTTGMTWRLQRGVLLVWVDELHWAKLCFERSPAGERMVVSVVTRGTSDDANGEVVDGDSVWLRVSRVGRMFAFHASTDGRSWRFARAFTLDGDEPARIGFEAQSPVGDGCEVAFDNLHFERRTLGDLRDGR